MELVTLGIGIDQNHLGLNIECNILKTFLRLSVLKKTSNIITNSTQPNRFSLLDL